MFKEVMNDLWLARIYTDPIIHILNKIKIIQLKIMCNFHSLHPRWLLLLKVEIPLNGTQKKKN
jgi:hypothetical protein